MFITFEGIDGCGKSTQARKLSEHLPNALLTREPGGSANAESIRTLLVTGASNRWDTETELLLFTAARRDHVQTVVKPALDSGKIVVCDRYIDSTRAYQSDLQTRDIIEHLHETFVVLNPDITFWIDTPTDIAARRIQARAGQKGESRFESKGRGFQDKLNEQFSKLTQMYADRIKRINGNQSEDAIFADILTYL